MAEVIVAPPAMVTTEGKARIDAALHTKHGSEAECIRALKNLLDNIAKWPDGRKRVAKVIAAYNGWGDDDEAIADADLIIQAGVDALRAFDEANEAFARAIVGQ